MVAKLNTPLLLAARCATSQPPAAPALLCAGAVPLMIAAWSVGTTQREKYQYRQSIAYTDTPMSGWERRRTVAAMTWRVA